ncbi:hypothetical protein QAD02_003913 [Eretmocerus hayati]|uniref:Uncharacterized protein n=1 Tax=Eretmocerus hayati TaxID=131215 RepID=A0ACC2NN19_9HYME|nr:hypothetical protein QAD02_003913 [Eretmocerus hayati]
MGASDHLPVQTGIQIVEDNAIPTCDSRRTQDKLTWKNAVGKIFMNMMAEKAEDTNHSSISTSGLNQAFKVTTKETARELVTMRQIVVRNHPKASNKIWVNQECHQANKKQNSLLRRCRRSNSETDRLEYLQAKKFHRNLRKSMMKQYIADQQAKIANVQDPKTFWSTEKKYRDESSQSALYQKFRWKNCIEKYTLHANPRG